MYIEKLDTDQNFQRSKFNPNKPILQNKGSCPMPNSEMVVNKFQGCQKSNKMLLRRRNYVIQHKDIVVKIR